MTTYFGFAIADGMFPARCTVSRRALHLDEVKDYIEVGVVPCLNPSHKPTIEALRSRYGIEVQVPERAPRVSLQNGDSVVVMSVRGLPRLEGRHEYTDEEIQGAEFVFGLWTVVAG